MWRILLRVTKKFTALVYAENEIYVFACPECHVENTFVMWLCRPYAPFNAQIEIVLQDKKLCEYSKLL